MIKSVAITLFAGLILAASVSSAVTVNFITDEGYSGDGTSWDSRLDAQVPTVGTNWVETRTGSIGRFRVNSAGDGLLQLDGDASYSKAIYQEALLTSNQTYRVGIKFSFNRATNEISALAKVIGVELTEVATGGNRIALMFERQKAANSGKYRLNFWSNTGSTAAGNAGWSDESDWGFASSDDLVSDPLWLEMTLYRGADASSWMVSGVLSNMTTGYSVEMATDVVGTFDTSSAYFTDPLYAVMNSCDTDDALNVSSRAIDLFAIGTPEFPTPEPEPDVVSETIEFTSAEGYSDGQLVANANWNGHSNFEVDSTEGSVTLDGTTSYKRIIYNQSQGVADRYTVGIRFSYDRAETTSTGNSYVLGLEFSDAATTDGGRIAMQIQRPNWDPTLYRLAFYENSGTTSSANSTAVSEDNFGFGTGDSVSDELWFSMTLARGSDASSWTVSGVLSNLTTGAAVMTLAEMTIDTSSDYFDGNVYGALNSLNLESDSYVSNRVIDAFYIANETDPVVEPATPYEGWTTGYSLSGDDALMSADPDGDGYSNIFEYGLGGDPTVADGSINLPVGIVNGDLFELVHVALTNSASGIEYIVETTTNLVSGTWTNAGITTVSGSFASDASFNSVTNRIATDGVPSGFMRLRIEEQQ